uniref:hypothetical protein n=1 Tax=Herbidospora sakaeratensis TaxID=564415 RepID=UPI000A9B8506|nr:hypothetical protein [Herbidospora sakaeratensis]
MQGEKPLYSAEHITVLRFEDAVRKRPAMYFGVGQQSPDLPTEVLRAVVMDALHNGEPWNVSVEIAGDLRFTVVDDQPHVTDEHGVPLLGFFDSLLDRERWAPAAAAALSLRTMVEVWMDGRGFRQRLIATQPVDAPAEFAPPTPQGTRLTPGATISRSPIPLRGEP